MARTIVSLYHIINFGFIYQLPFGPNSLAMAPTSDVIIIGAGPVGLLAALILVRKGLKVTVLEKAHCISDSPRAIVYLPQTMSTLEEAGVLEDVKEAGLVTENGPVFRKASSHEVLATVRSDALNEEDMPKPDHRNAVLLGQHLLAEIALQKLQENGTTVLFDTAFQSLEQDNSSVIVTALSAGKLEVFEASYVLGCDGSHSAVRKALGIQFEGFTHDIVFMAVNFRYKNMLDTGFSSAQYLVDPRENKADTDFAIILRTGRGDVWRCAYGDDGSLSEEEMRARMLGRLKRILPLHPDPEQVEILQAQPYKIHQRAATTYVKGRSLLAGDAAHVNNPVGGMGLCTGILDAHVATLALEKAVREGAEAGTVALQQYNADRRAAFLELTNPVTIDNLRMLCEEGKEADELRNGFFAKMNASLDFQRGVQLSMNKMAKGLPGF